MGILKRFRPHNSTVHVTVLFVSVPTIKDASVTPCTEAFKHAVFNYLKKSYFSSTKFHVVLHPVFAKATLSKSEIIPWWDNVFVIFKEMLHFLWKMLQQMIQ